MKLSRYFSLALMIFGAALPLSSMDDSMDVEMEEERFLTQRQIDALMAGLDDGDETMGSPSAGGSAGGYGTWSGASDSAGSLDTQRCLTPIASVSLLGRGVLPQEGRAADSEPAASPQSPGLFASRVARLKKRCQALAEARREYLKLCDSGDARGLRRRLVLLSARVSGAVYQSPAADAAEEALIARFTAHLRKQRRRDITCLLPFKANLRQVGAESLERLIDCCDRILSMAAESGGHGLNDLLGERDVLAEKIFTNQAYPTYEIYRALLEGFRELEAGAR